MTWSSRQDRYTPAGDQRFTGGTAGSRTKCSRRRSLTWLRGHRLDGTATVSAEVDGFRKAQKELKAPHSRGEVLDGVSQEHRRRPLEKTIQGRPEKTSRLPNNSDDGTTDRTRNNLRTLPRSVRGVRVYGLPTLPPTDLGLVSEHVVAAPVRRRRGKSGDRGRTPELHPRI